MTQQEQEELNASMLEIYGYSFDECLELSHKTREIKTWHNSTPLSKINRVAYAIHSKRKSMGAERGSRYTYEKVWSGRITRKEYLKRLAGIDRKECGMFLCKIEYNDLTDDRWWDVPSYRASHLKSYRSKITAIRKEYGLTSSEVACFMRVA